MKLEDKIKLSKANHKLWIKNLEKYGKLQSKRLDGTITEEELEEMKNLVMPPTNWNQGSKTKTKPKAKTKPKKKIPPKPPEPEPEPEVEFVPADPLDDILEAVDAGMMEPIIPLSEEEEKAIRKAELQAQIDGLEGS